MIHVCRGPAMREAHRELWEERWCFRCRRRQPHDAVFMVAWNSFYVDIIKAAGGNDTVADQVCRELRRRKLLAGQGRGDFATYYPTEKGREAVA